MAPPVRHPTLGLLLIFALGFPFFGDLLHLGHAGGNALAHLAEGASAPSEFIQILRPSATSPVADGNLSMIEVSVVDPVDGIVDQVEIAFDGDDQWITAHRASEDPTRWRHIWSDPTPGYHRIRVRAHGIAGQQLAEQSTIVHVEDSWTSTYIVDNPYGLPGVFRKGQLHMHSTASFDAWNSLPPAHLALAYKSRGYHFVALTDHDVVAHPKEVNDENFITIPGFESTADSGHITGLFTTRAVSPSLPPQDRIDGIVAGGGMAILNHPGWRVGWTGTDFTRLNSYSAIEIYNGMTSDLQRGAAANIGFWQSVLNTKGWPNRVWAVAVDDSHIIEEADRGWVMVKAAQLTPEAIRHSLHTGAFYASNGPSFSTIGVLGGAITAASHDASVIRFYDQDGNLLLEAPSAWGAYRPSGKERWVRVEAVMPDGRAAWSQPFWLIPNAPRVTLSSTPAGPVLTGETVPGARVHLSDRGHYLGSVVANGEGVFSYTSASLAEGDHDFWIMATAPWPDQVEGPPTLLSWGANAGRPLLETLGRWILGTPLGTARGSTQEGLAPRS
jgi:hypothetical protein